MLKNMTQQALVDRMEVERQYVWKIEHEKVSISLDYLDNIIRGLGCSPSEFLEPTSR
jgi:transcriptional regulator with XRE-family HTH domain